MKTQTITEYQRSQPNYLNEIFPREIHGWNKFSYKDRAEMIKTERDRLLKECWTENKDGSWKNK